MDELSVKTTPLTQAGLAALPSAVARPSYDRAALRPGIVHIGMGNFHRAHQAWYLHRLMEQGIAHDWAIIGAGVRPGDAKMREQLLAQDCLTTLIELRPDGSSAEVLGSIIGFLPVEEDNAALIAQMAEPVIRIVSLTVTEGGYFLNPATGAFDAKHSDIAHDVAHPDAPRTAFGAIIAALSLRRARGHAAFSVQSCDNLRGNGDISRDAVLTLARLIDPSLADWIATETAFPNSMVDCIVPATGPKEIARAEAFGIGDSVPVTHENFRQWVIEDRFSAGRPKWEDVGVTFTDDVHAYEAMKIRILNAGHQVLANAGELLSMGTISGAMQHADLAAYFRRVQREEILPYVAPVPEITPSDYAALIERRFANPAIHDTTQRVVFDGSNRHSSFVLPILRDAHAAGGSIEGLSLVEALWARMCAGKRDDGSKIDASDPIWSDLVAAAQASRARPAAWLEQKAIYGELAEDIRFATAFERWLTRLWTEGTEATIRAYAHP